MIQAIIGNVDDCYLKLKPFYESESARGNLEIIGYASVNKTSEGGGHLSLYKDPDLTIPLNNLAASIIIISSENNYFHYLDIYKNHNIPPEKVIDGRIFQIEGFDFPRFIKEGVAYGQKQSFDIADITLSIYPRIHNRIGSQILLNTKSYISSGKIEGVGNIIVGKWSALSWNIVFELGLNSDHHLEFVSNYGMSHLDWKNPILEYKQWVAELNIGNDVWIGRGAIIKVDKKLTIGNGAIIAADSVVVKDVPPYAIVGGNPAKFIKWRFDEKIREGLNKIAWWDWSLDKIRVNYNLMAAPEKFVEKFLTEV